MTSRDIACAVIATASCISLFVTKYTIKNKDDEYNELQRIAAANIKLVELFVKYSDPKVIERIDTEIEFNWDIPE